MQLELREGVLRRVRIGWLGRAMNVVRRPQRALLRVERFPREGLRRSNRFCTESRPARDVFRIKPHPRAEQHHYEHARPPKLRHAAPRTSE